MKLGIPLVYVKSEDTLRKYGFIGGLVRVVETCLVKYVFPKVSDRKCIYRDYLEYL